MKKPLETARRWLAQAEHSLQTSELMLENGLWAEACFQAEQTALLSLKAFLYFKGRRYVLIHSVRELVQECGKESAEFLPMLEYGGVMDRYYLSTRYPDALPSPAIPYQSFTEGEARQAVDYATEIVGLVRSQIPQP